MNVKTYNLFLLDGIGALVSILSLGYLLVLFNVYIGMPIDTLYVLAAIAAFFTLYSITCYGIKPKNPEPFLRIIGIGNLSYSLITALLIFLFWKELEVMGKIYFIGEILILRVLAYVEVKQSYSKKE